MLFNKTVQYTIVYCIVLLNSILFHPCLFQNDAWFSQHPGVRCSSVEEHLFMVQWVSISIPHGGISELFLIPASSPQLV